MPATSPPSMTRPPSFSWSVFVVRASRAVFGGSANPSGSGCGIEVFARGPLLIRRNPGLGGGAQAAMMRAPRVAPAAGHPVPPPNRSGIAAAFRAGQQLQDVLLKLHGIVPSHSSVIGKTRTWWVKSPSAKPGQLCVGVDSEVWLVARAATITWWALSTTA